MRIKNFAVIILLLNLSAVTVTSQTILTSLEEIAIYGSEHNLNYKNSQINVLKTEESKESFLKLKNSSISTQGSIQSVSDQNASLGFSSTLTIPVIDQFSVSGTIEDDLSGQLGISLSPFTHSATSKQSELSYNISLISAESNRIKAENDAISASLNWMSGLKELDTQKRSSELAEIKYNDDKIRYDLGEITLDDLQDSLINWSEAIVQFSVEQQNFRTLESKLYSTLGTGTNDIKVNVFTNDELETALLSLKGSLDGRKGNPLNNSTYTTSLLNVKSTEAGMINTWIFEPDLKAGVNLVFDDSGIMNINGNLELTISLDDFQKKKRDIAEQEYQISIKEAEQSLNETNLEYEQIIEAISSSNINTEISRLEYEQAKILNSEAKLLQKMGEYSEVELEESRLTMIEAENTFFKALSDEYQAWIQLKPFI
jgi:outer membrane protein TolC